MSEASQKAKTAAAQAKAAASNSAGALDAAAEEAAEGVARIDVKKVSGGIGNVGQGFIAVSVALYAAAFAYAKFRKAGEQSYVAPPGQ